MDQNDLIVYGMCAFMILVGVIIIRISKRDRGMGAVAIVLGIIGLLAYITAEEGAPPPEATPTAVSVSPDATTAP